MKLSTYRSFYKNKWPQLLLLAGVFFMANFIVVPTASAQPGNKFQVEAPEVSILEKNEQELSELNKSFKTEQEKLEEKNETVDKLKKEASVAHETKSKLEAELVDKREEIKILEIKLAEKRRLEAERTVTVSRAAGDAAGNLYALGNCTWYVKQKRPDIGNLWGNANMWYTSAAAQGFKTGTMAKKNAIGVSFEGWAGHVVYVEKWLGNGRILISEMNVGGLYNTQTREADESEFVYIYEL